MYNRIRQLHLFSAFFLTTFILMYFVTGLVMILEKSFERKDTAVNKFKKEIVGIHKNSNDTLISLLKEHAGVSGQYRINKNSEERTVANFMHPGTETRVVIDSGSDTVNVSVKKRNFIAVLHHFHRLHGYEGGFQYYLWAFIFDLSALSMLVFALTGVYLWYKNERNKLPGWLIIIAFTAYTGFTLYYLLHIG